ncbi:MAG: 16S rRNA (cytidine(1402)-2'-O)-methyltransferase [Myxococcales bacterium]|nr:16S rRNA (cytidine(1402)-2'-O)-methyltransferase [Myxococcales bacterium]
MRPAGGRLSVVGTPIGCLDDITLRALRVLGEADAVLAEDTRRTRGLLSHHGISARVVSVHAHTSAARIEAIAGELAEGAHYALVTDAGTPVVSDPGAPLVAACAALGVRVEAIPGPSAVLAAISIAGLPAGEFRFVGFLPRAGARRRRALARIAAEPAAVVLFESPRRVGGTLRDLADTLAEGRRVAVCRELTKVHEEVLVDTPRALAERFSEAPRGELTLVIEASGDPDAAPRRDETAPGLDAYAAEVRALLAAGTSARDAGQQLARRAGVSKRDAYQFVLAQRDEA